MRNGFPEIALDGYDAPELRDALKACPDMNSCFRKLFDAF